MIRGLSRRLAAAAIIAPAALGVACAGPAAPPARRAALTVPSLPEDLEALDASIRAQLGERHAAVERARQAGTGDVALGRAFGELGMVFHAYGYLDAAALCYRQAAALDPASFRWVYYQGRAEHGRGHWQASRAAQERALALDPDHVPTLVWMAEDALAASDGEQAEALFQRALDHDPGCAAAQVGLGRTALARGDHRQAVEHLEPVVASQPQAVEVRYALGLAYRGLGEREKAREQLDRVPAQNLFQSALAVDDPLMVAIADLRIGARAHDLRGMKAAAEGRHDLAAVEFRQALSANPERVYTGYALALSLLHSGRRREAIEALETLLDKAPEHAPSQLLLARLLRDDGDAARARALLEALLALDPAAEEAHLALAELLRTGGDVEAALGHYRQAQSLDPTLETARFGELRALLDAGRAAALAQRLAAHRRALPASPLLRLFEARLRAAAPTAEHRDPEGALALARAAFATAPTVAAAETVAMAHAAGGDFARALRWQQAAAAAFTNRAPPPWLNDRLAAYRSGAPAAGPFTVDEQMLDARVAPPAER